MDYLQRERPGPDKPMLAHPVTVFPLSSLSRTCSPPVQTPPALDLLKPRVPIITGPRPSRGVGCGLQSLRRVSSLFKSIRTVERFKPSPNLNSTMCKNICRMPNHGRSWARSELSSTLNVSFTLSAIEMIRDPLWLEERNALCTPSSPSACLYLVLSISPPRSRIRSIAWHFLSTSPSGRCFLTPCGQRRVALSRPHEQTRG